MLTLHAQMHLDESKARALAILQEGDIVGALNGFRRDLDQLPETANPTLDSMLTELGLRDLLEQDEDRVLRMIESSPDRASLLAQAKKRALAYVEADNLPQAIAAMLSDLDNVPGTTREANDALGQQAVGLAMDGDAEGLRKPRRPD